MWAYALSRGILQVQQGCVKKDVPFLQFLVTFSFFEELEPETVDSLCPNKVTTLHYGWCTF
jgi:hypothetical protein